MRQFKAVVKRVWTARRWRFQLQHLSMTHSCRICLALAADAGRMLPVRRVWRRVAEFF